MGMSEDDRIRAKNYKHQEAYDTYEGLKTLGYDNAYIIKYAEFASQNTTDQFRNEIYKTLISMVRGLNEKATSN
jgi:hypothetical protein